MTDNATANTTANTTSNTTDYTTASYDDLLKLLKPFQVILNRLSADRLATLKVVDDPNLIKDEVLPKAVTEIKQTFDEPSLESEEEICIDISLLNGVNHVNRHHISDSDVADDGVDGVDDSASYSCFFCKQSVVGYWHAFAHYQLHIDYFPIQCSTCDEANIDVNSFVNHFRKTHENLTKANYLRKINLRDENWIRTYLRSQTSGSSSVSVHLYCPACNWIHMNPDVNSQNGESAQQQKNAIEVLAHIHEHIQYVPFECMKCRENGVKFCIPVLDSRVRKHLLSAHSNYEAPGWQYFNKKYAIPPLDKFIANYLGIFGLKIPRKRFKKPKPKPLPDNSINQITPQKALSIEPIVMNGYKSIKVGINGNVSPTPANSQILISKSGQTLVVPSLLPSLSMSYAPQTKKLENLFHPILMYPSNNQLNIKPFPMESTDLGVICVDPKMEIIDDRKFSYVCVFCMNQTLNFNSKFEACIHYAQHLNYYPIVCLLCQNKFSEMMELLTHYENEHKLYCDNIFHYLKEDQNVENWIESFLDFQKTYDFKAQVSGTFGDYCFVCRKLTEKEGGIKMDLKKLDIDAIKTHIYQHFNYYPHVCTICMHGGRTVRFSYLNSSVSIHFKHFHGFTNLKIDELSKFIAKSNEIYELEKFVDELIFAKTRTIETKPITLKRKLDVLLQEKPTKKPNALSISAVSKDIPKSIIKVNNTINNQPLKSNNIFQNIMKTITPKCPKIESLLKSESKSCEPFLKCYHCHAFVSSIQLESHHRNTHPNLTIASYTPNKSDVIKHLNASKITSVIILE